MGSIKKIQNKSDTFITSEVRLVYFNYVEINSHEKRHLKRTEKVRNKGENEM